MRIAIFGTGGVGGYFGGRLASAGEEVAFIARGAHLEAIQRQGLRVESVAGDFEVRPAEATDDPGEVGPVDAVVVAVKSWQLPAATEQMAPLIGTETTVLPLLNGVEAPSILARAQGQEHVLGGLCGIVSFKAGPGRIRHAGVEPFVRLGELEGGSSRRVRALQESFRRAGVKAEVPADIRVAMWEKLVFIAAVSGVGAVTQAPLGVMRDVPQTRELIEMAMRETVAVGQASGVAIQEEAVAKAMGFVDRLPAESTTSMQRDLLAGRRSELEAQSGVVVRLAGETGAEAPVHRFLYASLLPLELRARGEVEY